MDLSLLFQDVWGKSVEEWPVNKCKDLIISTHFMDVSPSQQRPSKSDVDFELIVRQTLLKASVNQQTSWFATLVLRKWRSDLPITIPRNKFTKKRSTDYLLNFDITMLPLLIYYGFLSRGNARPFGRPETDICIAPFTRGTPCDRCGGVNGGTCDGGLCSEWTLLYR